MSYLLHGLLVVTAAHFVRSQSCDVKCPLTLDAKDLVCGFDASNVRYKLFPSKCAMDAQMSCYKQGYIESPMEYCVKFHNNEIKTRREYGESCPVFCPSHYRPVCGALKRRAYKYRAFNNGCHMDMLNCGVSEEDEGYVEVPLEFCQGHLMKAIFSEKIEFTHLHNVRDYEQ